MLTPKEFSQLKQALRSSVRVRDIETVKHFLKKGEHTSNKTYETLCRITAETGALTVPFGELPKVRKILEAR